MPVVELERSHLSKRAWRLPVEATHIRISGLWIEPFIPNIEIMLRDDSTTLIWNTTWWPYFSDSLNFMSIINHPVVIGFSTLFLLIMTMISPTFGSSMKKWRKPLLP